MTDWDSLLTTKTSSGKRKRYKSLSGHLPTKLEVLIRQKNLYDYQVASEAGVNPSHLSRYKTGHRIPPPEVQMKLATYFNVDPMDIVGFITPSTSITPSTPVE